MFEITSRRCPNRKRTSSRKKANGKPRTSVRRLLNHQVKQKIMNETWHFIYRICGPGHQFFIIKFSLIIWCFFFHNILPHSRHSHRWKCFNRPEGFVQNLFSGYLRRLLPWLYNLVYVTFNHFVILNRLVRWCNLIYWGIILQFFIWLFFVKFN